MNPLARVHSWRRVAGLSVLFWSPALWAQIVIQVGSLSLLPNAPDQLLEFSMTNQSLSDYLFQGFELNIQIGDGGAAAGGVTIGPAITGADLVTDTLFQGNSVGTSNASGSAQNLHPLLGFYSTVTAVGTVTLPAGATRPIGRITFDTTGFNEGNWSLALRDTINGPSKFVNLSTGGEDGLGNIFPTITDGLVTIVPVPEPISISVASGLLMTLLGWRLRFGNHRPTA